VIVEVEAYIGESDPACHAAPGPTRRNQPLYGEPGHAYVYLNYGVHYLVNVVTEPKGSPAAVLIRALQPLDGVPLMRRRRAARGGSRRPGDLDLCRGPGNLTCAMGITLAHNELDLTGSRLYVADAVVNGHPPDDVAWGPRIGIRVGTDRPWRCYVAGHPAVSRVRIGVRAARDQSAP
jgi:DNA-3-methyladenine glycosylase